MYSCFVHGWQKLRSRHAAERHRSACIRVRPLFTDGNDCAGMRSRGTKCVACIRVRPWSHERTHEVTSDADQTNIGTLSNIHGYVVNHLVMHRMWVMLWKCWSWALELLRARQLQSETVRSAFRRCHGFCRTRVRVHLDR